MGNHLGLRKSLLQRCRLSGGLALPNFLTYYWAAHIHKLCYWLKSPGSSWCKLELSSCGGSSIPALLYSSLPTKPSLYTDSQVVLNTLKIWCQFRRHFKFVAASSLGPLNNNHLFPPSLSDSTFSVWHDKGITHFKYLYVDGVFDSFANLATASLLLIWFAIFKLVILWLSVSLISPLYLQNSSGKPCFNL